MATSSMNQNNSNMPATEETNQTPQMNTEPIVNPARNLQFGQIAIEAKEIVNRLEQVAEGVNLNNAAFNQTTVLLSRDKKREDEIMQTIQTLISTDEDGEPATLPVLDNIAKLVITSHSLAAYCGNLDKVILQKLSTRFTTDTTRWLSKMFGFLDSSAFYHEDQLEGLVRITRMILHYKYPRYVEDGALAYTAAPPTIYSSVASPLGVVQHLCRQLGLPLSCVRPVPVNTHFGSPYTMDCVALQKMLAEDIGSGRTPLIVIADAGTPITGHLDNIPRLQELCKASGVWLHLRGHSLASLVLLPEVEQPSIADSFTLPLCSWLGLPGLPMITLYKLWEKPTEARNRQVGTTRESTLPLIAGLTNDHQGRRITSLPLWVALQALGREGVHTRIRDNFLATERLWAAIDCYRQVRVLSQKPGGESGTYTVSELISKSCTVPILFDTTACSVVFQFIPEAKQGESLKSVPPYYNKLNSWLGQILQLDAPQVPIDICELENVGVVLRFCPFDHTVGQQPSAADIESFVQCLEQQLIILRATIQHKETFIKLIDESPVLRLVELPEWAGLGGVRYAPEGWEDLLTDQAKEELNSLNIALVESLRSTDSAFSLGEGADGLMCVRFGMLTPQSEVDELINLVIRVGQNVEENSRVFDSMSEIVKRGIETATLDLQKENEEKMWQDGILRQVPVVGTFMNWFAPKTKETGVRGVKSPPTPQIQTPVGGSHSRSSSHASQASQGSVVNQVQTQLAAVKIIDKEVAPSVPPPAASPTDDSRRNHDPKVSAK